MAGSLIDLLVCYDIETLTDAGRRRLRRMGRLCMRYGQRVQKSVFECRVSARTLVRLRDRVGREIDGRTDSVRFYFLRGERGEWLEVMGVDEDHSFLSQ